MTSPQQGGRPKAKKSYAAMTIRLQILLSNDDKEKINAIMQSTGAVSMGQVIRDSIDAEYKRLKPMKVQS